MDDQDEAAASLIFYLQANEAPFQLPPLKVASPIPHIRYPASAS